MHRAFFMPVKALPPVPNGPETGGGRCHATYLCGERFNSRPPRGGRRIIMDAVGSAMKFQSTPSARRATSVACCVVYMAWISIHALREEGDRKGHLGENIGQLFQSTPSARRATVYFADSAKNAVISIHALREEGD